MNMKQALQFQKEAEKLDIKVTITNRGGSIYVSFRDFYLNNLALAQLHIHHIAMTEMPDNVDRVIDFYKVRP